MPQPSTFSPMMVAAIAPARAHSLGVSASRTRTSAAAVAGLIVPVDWPICAAVTRAPPVVSAARMSMITGPSFARVTCHPYGHRVLGHGGGRPGVLHLLLAGRTLPA